MPAKRDDSTLNIHAEVAALEQFNVLREIGAGGMSIVYLAENLHMGRRKEALKILSATHLRQPGAKERFEQEIAVAASLHHPNIVTAYNVYKLPSLTIFAMQYIEGQDLEQFVHASGRVRVADACGIVRQVAAGLQYAMEMKTIHRDIKPANLMLTKSGTKDVVKILDFGLAKAQMETVDHSALTASGMVMGTPSFMAPEQFKNAANVDIRADIYSLGCTLYFLLSGRAPFSGSLYEVLQSHQSAAVIPLKSLRPDIPSDLEVAIGKMLAKEPTKRFQTPNQIISAMAPFLRVKSPAPGQGQVTSSGSADTDAIRNLHVSTLVATEPQTDSKSNPAQGTVVAGSTDASHAPPSPRIPTASHTEAGHAKIELFKQDDNAVTGLPIVSKSPQRVESPRKSLLEKIARQIIIAINCIGLQPEVAAPKKTSICSPFFWFACVNCLLLNAVVWSSGEPLIFFTVSPLLVAGLVFALGEWRLRFRAATLGSSLLVILASYYLSPVFFPKSIFYLSIEEVCSIIACLCAMVFICQLTHMLLSVAFWDRKLLVRKICEVVAVTAIFASAILLISKPVDSSLGFIAVVLSIYSIMALLSLKNKLACSVLLVIFASVCIAAIYYEESLGMASGLFASIWIAGSGKWLDEMGITFPFKQWSALLARRANRLLNRTSTSPIHGSNEPKSQTNNLRFFLIAGLPTLAVTAWDTFWLPLVTADDFAMRLWLFTLVFYTILFYLGNRLAAAVVAICVGSVLVLKPYVVPVALQYIPEHHFGYYTLESAQFWIPGILLLFSAIPPLKTSTKESLTLNFLRLRPTGVAGFVLVATCLLIYLDHRRPTVYDTLLATKPSRSLQKDALRNIRTELETSIAPLTLSQKLNPRLVLDTEELAMYRTHASDADRPLFTGFVLLDYCLSKDLAYSDDVSDKLFCDSILGDESMYLGSSLYDPMTSYQANELQSRLDAPYVVLVKGSWGETESYDWFEKLDYAKVGPFRVFLYDLRSDKLLFSKDIDSQVGNSNELKEATLSLLESSVDAQIWRPK